MKVIFLDVDGVLNSEVEFREAANKGIKTSAIIGDEHLKLLKHIVNVTGARIVVSSTWRLGVTRTPNGVFRGDSYFEKLKDDLKRFDIEILDVTPNLNGERGDEIKRWISNYEKDHPKLESFVILDDDSDMGEFTETNLVHTSFKDGLQVSHMKKAINILGEN